MSHAAAWTLQGGTYVGAGTLPPTTFWVEGDAAGSSLKDITFVFAATLPSSSVGAASPSAQMSPAGMVAQATQPGVTGPSTTAPATQPATTQATNKSTVELAKKAKAQVCAQDTGEYGDPGYIGLPGTNGTTAQDLFSVIRKEAPNTMPIYELDIQAHGAA